MTLLLPLQIPALQPRLQLSDHILLAGSCFTEHMSGFLRRSGFRVAENPHGIVFNPLSVCKALEDVAMQKEYSLADLFQLNEYWHSWYHHSHFSHRDPQKTLQAINERIQEQHQFLKQADAVFLTLGSAFAYFHLEQQHYVSNNHRAPVASFRKDLLDVDTMRSALVQTMERLLQLNPRLRFVVTISPVRHVRDGVIDNNRSKARLIETVHSLPDTYYFPAYELVMDVLRDYRFYDIDLVHPNYAATRYVWEQFVQSAIEPSALPVMQRMEQLWNARHHRPRDTGSEAHREFMERHLALCLELQQAYPFLQLEEMLDYFRQKAN